MYMKKQILFNVAAYIRLSREDGDKAESDSIGNQRKLITDYLKDRDELILYDTYIDDGYSGTNFRRPAFGRMLADIEAGEVNCVIVKDLSRFGRDYIDTGKYLERYFPDHDVRFISITDHIDSMKQAYDMLLPIKNIFNEQYARDISKKVHAAMQTKQHAGEFIGAFACYGYQKSLTDKNKLVVDEYAAQVVRQIFSLYLSGYGKIRIAGILNEQGIVCPSEYKKQNGEHYHNCHRLDSTSYWTYSTINRILQNEMYIGNMVQGKKCQRMRGKQRARDREDWIIVPNTHEAIIDADTWQKTQELLKRRTRELDLESNTSIFAGFLKCGDCGRALVKKMGSGGINYYCGTYVRSGRHYCTPHPISHELLERIILDDLKALIGSVDNLTELVEHNRQTMMRCEKQTETEQNRISAELAKVRRLKQSVYEDYCEELISKEEYIAYRQDYLNKEALYEKQLAVLDDKAQEKRTADMLDSPWIKRLLELKDIEKLDRDIVVEMVHEITVYENHKIKITYNFSNELEQLFQTVYTNLRKSS